MLIAELVRGRARLILDETFVPGGEGKIVSRLAPLGRAQDADTQRGRCQRLDISSPTSLTAWSSEVLDPRFDLTCRYRKMGRREHKHQSPDTLRPTQLEALRASIQVLKRCLNGRCRNTDRLPDRCRSWDTEPRRCSRRPFQAKVMKVKDIRVG